MRKNLLLSALFFVLAVALAISAPHETGNAVAVSDTSTFVSFNHRHGEVQFVNEGVQSAYVRVWQECETAAAITTTTAGVIEVPGAMFQGVPFNKEYECGNGYVGFTHIAASGQSTTLRYIAK